MNLILNHKAQNHFKHISKELKNSQVVTLAVAFLKQSGLNMLKADIEKALRRNVKFELYIGLSFGTTDASALEDLIQLSKKTGQIELYLLFPKSNITFHPKVWLFENGNNVNIISGSANLTKGGLSTNHECSLQTKVTKTDAIYQQLKQYFEDLKKDKTAVIATAKLIRQYIPYSKRQRGRQIGIIQNPDRPEVLDINLIKLKKTYNRLKNKFDFTHKDRAEWYEEAKEILDYIADNNLSKAEFIEEYEQLVGGINIDRIWHSSGLDRRKELVFRQHKTFRKMVQFVKANKDKDPAFVFEEATKFRDRINGVGPNIMAELMMTYNPKEFANINQNPIKVLQEVAQVDIKKTPRSYSGNDYRIYCDIIKDIRKELGLKTMLEMDTFFNKIYWELKNKERYA